jgi:ABC-type xylose transport system permease subunit
VTPSLFALLLANALPIIGVLFLGWTVFPLVLVYWLENVVVGGFNVAKLVFAKPSEPVFWAAKLFLVPFFLVHFGGFTYVHGALLIALFGPERTQPFDLLTTVPAAIRANQLGWAVFSLVLSHALSFYWNYIRNAEYQRASLQALMMQPYSRVIVLHLTVLFGGWIVMLLGSPTLALVLLVVLKTAADLRGHRAERRKFATGASAPVQPLADVQA